MVHIDFHERYLVEIENRQQLGVGLYTTREMMTNDAREKFMAVIANEIPECLDELKQIFRDNLSLITALLTKTRHRYPSTIEEIILHKEGEKLFELISNWTNKLNINEKWMLENALIAICSWFNNNDLTDEVYWYNHPQRQRLAKIGANEQRIKMESDPNFPKSPGDYCPLIHKNRKDYQKKLLDYMDQVERFYKEYGFVRTITKKGDSKKHFRWLVQYQLLGWKPEQIVAEHVRKHPKEENLSIYSVKKEIRKIAELIQINIVL